MGYLVSDDSYIALPDFTIILFKGKMIRINPKERKKIGILQQPRQKLANSLYGRFLGRIQRPDGWRLRITGTNLQKVCSTQKMTEKAGKNAPKEYTSALKTKRFRLRNSLLLLTFQMPNRSFF